MPIIQPDTSQAQDMAPINPGNYPAKITAADPGTSKSDKPKLVIKLDLAVEGKTRSRQDHIPINGAGAFKFDQLLRACGFGNLADQYKNPDGQKPEFDTDDLVGQELNVVMDLQMYEGQQRDTIKAYLPR